MRGREELGDLPIRFDRYSPRIERLDGKETRETPDAAFTKAIEALHATLVEEDDISEAEVWRVALLGAAALSKSQDPLMVAIGVRFLVQLHGRKGRERARHEKQEFVRERIGLDVKAKKEKVAIIQSVTDIDRATAAKRLKADCMRIRAPK